MVIVVIMVIMVITEAVALEYHLICKSVLLSLFF